MDLRELAFLASRLTAVYGGTRALSQVPPIGRAWGLPHSLALVAGAAVLLLWIALSLGLWLGAGRIAAFVGGWRSPRPFAKSGRDDIQSLAFTTLGLVVTVDGLAGLIEALPGWRMGVWTWVAVAVASATVLLGLWPALGAFEVVPGLGWLKGLVTSISKAPVRPGEEANTTALLRELIASGRAAGLNRLGELAQSLRAEAEGVALRVVKSSIDAVIASVERRRPDFGGAMAADGAVTIAFSDMEGFSAMTERLGDRKAHAVIQSHNAIVRAALKAHGGKEVELQGDGFLLAFPSPAQAVQCASAIQRACAAHSARRGAEPIRVRIGLHTGTPIKEGDRFFGITVILAARIAGQAGGGEILLSSAVHALVADDGELVFGECREAALKGLAGTHRMVPLLWDA